MEICPTCHQPIRQPLATSVETLLLYYLGAILLPPLGIIWGWKYLKQRDQTSKIHGAILIGLTIIVSIILTRWTMNLVNSVSSQINGFQGY